MIRLTELKLPLDHAEGALAALIARTLGIRTEQIISFDIHKRSFDARKAELLQVFLVDVALAASLEAEMLAKFAGSPHILPSPDMAYHSVGQAPASQQLRPVVTPAAV